jgi:hypothetical protein
MHATLTMQLALHQFQAGQWRSGQVRIPGQRSDLEINGVHVANKTMLRERFRINSCMEKGLFNLVSVSMHAWSFGPEHLSASRLRQNCML